MRRSATADQPGFTIIETLIVLAIAGLILMLVFEAIPALDRTSRNNQRKQDVQTILAAVSHYELSNSANLPDCGAADQPSCVGTGSNQLGNLQLSYYDSSQITVTATATYGNTSANGTTSTYNSASLSRANPNDVNQVDVYNHAKCDSSNDGSATALAASYSDVAALYTLENGGTGKTKECQQL